MLLATLGRTGPLLGRQSELFLFASPLFASVRLCSPFFAPHQMSTKQQNVTHNVSPAVAAVDDTKDNSNETDAQLTVSEYYSLSRTLA
jgi:hypothetical protein